MSDLHIDTQNNIYVTDTTNAQIVKFSSNHQKEIIIPPRNITGLSTDYFSGPLGNFIDINQTWYIADTENHRVQKWSSGATNGTTVAGISNSAGSNTTQLNRPRAVVVDNNG